MKHGSKLPCELIIWYVLPDLRNEISRIMYEDYNFKQVEIARALGVTKAAVNQYLSSKRGENFFNLVKNKTHKNMLMRELRKSAQTIVKEQSTIDMELCRMCNIIRRTKIINKVYEKYSTGVVPSCARDMDDSDLKSGTRIYVKCTGCKKDLDESWVACPYCGVSMLASCPGCGKDVNTAWKVCPYCARKITRKEMKAATRKK